MSFENPWKTQGEFPLGSLEGSAHLTADQLKDPLSVKVSFKYRRSLAWLYAAAALGLILGFVIKTWLANYLDLRRARSEGFSMLAEAKRQLSLTPGRDAGCGSQVRYGQPADRTRQNA